MKRALLICLILLMLFAVVGCSQQIDEIPSFSWAEAKDRYMGAPGGVRGGVRTDGFKNTTKRTIKNSDDAISCAKSEVTVEYDTIVVAFDESEIVWRVNFGMREMLGGDQSVYLSADGITQLIVYGE